MFLPHQFGVQRDALVDLRRLRSGVTGAIELTRGHQLGRIAAGEQPALRTRRLPPCAEQIEQVATPRFSVTHPPSHVTLRPYASVVGSF